MQVNNLRLRVKPNLKSLTIGKLKEGEKVEFLGKLSSKKTKAMLKGINYNSFFVLIKTGSGKTGWVYLPALGKIKPKPFKDRALSYLQFRKRQKVLLRMAHPFDVGRYLVSNRFSTCIHYHEIFYYQSQKKYKLHSRIASYHDECTIIMYGFFTNSLVVESHTGVENYLFAPFPARPNGIRPYMSREQVKNILKARPYKETKNILVYLEIRKHDHCDDNEKGCPELGFVFFFSDENRLIAIYYRGADLGC